MRWGKQKNIYIKKSEYFNYDDLYIWYCSNKQGFSFKHYHKNPIHKMLINQPELKMKLISVSNIFRENFYSIYFKGDTKTIKFGQNIYLKKIVA